MIIYQVIDLVNIWQEGGHVLVKVILLHLLIPFLYLLEGKALVFMFYLVR